MGLSDVHLPCREKIDRSRQNSNLKSPTASSKSGFLVVVIIIDVGDVVEKKQYQTVLIAYVLLSRCIYENAEILLLRMDEKIFGIYCR